MSGTIVLEKKERLSSAADLGELSRRFAAADSGMDFSTTRRPRFQSPLWEKFMKNYKRGDNKTKKIKRQGLNENLKFLKALKKEQQEIKKAFKKIAAST